MITLRGFLWIGTTDGGLTRYRRSTTPPGIRIRKVELDDKEYTDFGTIPNITAGHHISIFYQELDFKTHPQKRQYQLRIRTEDGETVKSSLTKERRYDWTPKKVGSYTFEVKAIDRDLNYSQPASVAFSIVPPWYLNGWISIPSGGAILVMLLVSILSASRYYVQRRESQLLREQILEQEQNARRTLEEKNLQLEKSKEDAEAAKEEAETANQAKSIFLAKKLAAEVGEFQIHAKFSSDDTEARADFWSGTVESNSVAIRLRPREFQFKAFFATDKSEYRLGEPIYVLFTVHNVGDEEICYASGGDYRGTSRHNRFTFTAKSALGIPVVDPLEGIYDRGGANDAMKVAPGESAVEEHLLNNWCDFKEPGEYLIQCTRTLNLAKGTQHDFRRGTTADFLIEAKLQIHILPWEA